MEIKLEKSHIITLTALSAQKNELQKTFNDVVAAEKEYLSMLSKKLGLEKGEYGVRQGQDDDLYLYKIETVKTDEANSLPDR